MDRGAAPGPPRTGTPRQPPRAATGNRTVLGAVAKGMEEWQKMSATYSTERTIEIIALLLVASPVIGIALWSVLTVL